MRMISKYKFNEYRERTKEIYRYSRTLKEEAKLLMDELYHAASPVGDNLMFTQQEIEISGEISNMVIFMTYLELTGVPPEGEISEKDGKKIISI